MMKFRPPFPTTDSKKSSYMHLVLVDHLEGLNVSRDSVSGLTDLRDMTWIAWLGHKATTQTKAFHLKLYTSATCKCKSNTTVIIRILWDKGGNHRGCDKGDTIKSYDADFLGEIKLVWYGDGCKSDLSIDVILNIKN